MLQWKEELDARFVGLTFVVFDRDYIRRMRQERGYAVNPWATHSRFIVSHHLVRDEDYASPLRDWLGTFGSGSLLILDEAHNAAPASGARYAIDSNFTHRGRDLAGIGHPPGRVEHRVRRQAEVRPVEDVEHLGAQLNPHSVAHANVPEHRHVPRRETGTDQRVPRHVSEVPGIGQ